MALVDPARGLQSRKVTNWRVWQLEPMLRLYVCTVIAAAVAVAAGTAAATSWRARDMVLAGLLAVFSLAAVELAHRLAPPEPAGLIRDIVAVWLLPAAILLPPIYGLAVVALTFAALQMRARQTIVHRRLFSASAIGLTLAAVSFVFHALPAGAGRPLWWLLAMAGSAGAWLVISTALSGAAVWLADRTVSLRDAVLTPAALTEDVGELAAGVLLTGAIAGFGAVMLIPALPVVILLYKAVRAAQAGTRCDAGTGLLHADAWRAEAEVQLVHAQRTGAPLAVGILSIAVGGAHGHLARETVLAAAATIRSGLRPYDLTGQHGDQRILCLLPDITADGAQELGDRLRASLTGHPLAAGPGQHSVTLAVTIGIAAHSTPAETDLTGLLATAEAALYQAQQPGQRQVCVTPSYIPSWQDIEAARLKLGPLLCEARERAGLSQVALAHRIGCARSTVANAEAGRAASVEFWRDAVRETHADGKLLAERERIERMMPAARSRTARQGWRKRALRSR